MIITSKWVYYSWWFNQPIWKILVKLDHLGLKPPLSLLLGWRNQLAFCTSPLIRSWYIPLREISPTMFAPLLFLLFSGLTVSLCCKEFPFLRGWTCWKMIVLRLFKGKPPEISMIHGHIILSSPISTISTCRRMGNLHLGFEKSPVTAAVCCKAFMCFSTAKMAAYFCTEFLSCKHSARDLKWAPLSEMRSKAFRWASLGNGACGTGLWCFLSSSMGEPYKHFLFCVLSRTSVAPKLSCKHFWHVRAGWLWSRIFPTEWRRELWECVSSAPGHCSNVCVFNSSPTPAFQWSHFPSLPEMGWGCDPSILPARETGTMLTICYKVQGRPQKPVIYK